MAQIVQRIEMQRGGWNATGTAGTYCEIRAIQTKLNTADFDGTVTYYFEASIHNSDTAGSTTAYARLYNRTDGTAVSGSEVSTTENDGYPQRLRSGSISLSGDKVYTLQLKHSVNTSHTLSYSARIIVVQTGDITKTQIHHELGYEMSSSSTSSTNRYEGTMKFLYESDRYDGTVTIKHAAVLTATSGNTTYSGLYDETASSVVSNSTASTTSTYPTYSEIVKKVFTRFLRTKE